MAQANPTVVDAREDLRRRDREFISWLERQVPRVGDDGQPKGDRAVLSLLRRAAGLPPGDALDVYGVLYRALGEGPLPPWEEAPYLTVAPLFALYPEVGWRESTTSGERRRNLGASFARLKHATGSDSVTGRFRTLLECPLSELPEQLRHAVTLLRAHDVPISWPTLLGDIRVWERTSRESQKKWARTFWSQLARDERADAGAADEGTDLDSSADEEED